MANDELYTITDECGCCQQIGCAYAGGCSCKDSNGDSSTFSSGYTCNLCNVSYATHKCGWGKDCTSTNTAPLIGYLQKCDPNNPGHLIAVPCDSHEYSYVLASFGTFSPGNMVCTIPAASVVLTNYTPGSTTPGYEFSGGCSQNPPCTNIINANGQLIEYPKEQTEGQPGCIFRYGGYDIQQSPDPITRCATFSVCSECTQNGPTSTNSNYRGYSGFEIVLYINPRPDLGITLPSIGMSMGNFVTSTGCYSRGVIYILDTVIPNDRIKCSGPNIFKNIGDPTFGFPATITIEVL